MFSLRNVSTALLLPAVLSTLAGCMSPFDTPDDLRVESLHARMVPDDRFRIDATLVTNYNFAKYIKSHGYSAGWHGYFCSKPDYEIVLGGATIFDDANPPHRVSREYPGFDTSDKELYKYTIDINGLRKRTDAPTGSKGQLSIDVFDLRKDAEDICLRFSGGVLFWGFRSNTMVIPKAAIQAAVRDLPPPPEK